MKHLKHHRRVRLCWPCLGAALTLGCPSQVETIERAQAQVAKIDEACRANQPEQARSLMEQAAKDDAVFRRAFEGATSGVPDRNRMNPCGLILADLKIRLDNMKKHAK